MPHGTSAFIEAVTTREENRERIRVLQQYIKPHRKVLILGVVLGLAGTATSLATPLAIKWIPDSLGELGGSLDSGMRALAPSRRQ
ncbi:hypothetical protein [Actinomyces sp. MRS3W]|uniref:hypothetical protein n=1 Tax=Actinomyces sp. MRS3W TaxID=2800796 RepID=UPI0028FDA3F6|nr:hypothetical protein [Actinomyces sp. MRS3W]MDU0349621.1 hypothetical protein [Actinomyces sp. MRS3W]